MTHAWLFTGPPGSGRSVAARAFAAALLCRDGGCGAGHDQHCAACRQVHAGTHADLMVVRPDGLSYGVKQTRELVLRAAGAPSGGRWRIVLFEDADRCTEQAANALLKAIEEPAPRTVWLLCAPSAEDLVTTIRSRCRVVTLRVPSSAAVASVLTERDGIDPAAALAAARAAQGHVGRAKRLATDPEARRRREQVLAVPMRARSLGPALAAAAALVKTAEDEAKAVTEELDEPERDALRQAFGEGSTGKGVAKAMRGGGRGPARPGRPAEVPGHPAQAGQPGPGPARPGRLLPRRADDPGPVRSRIGQRGPRGGSARAGVVFQSRGHPAPDRGHHALPGTARGQRGPVAGGGGDDHRPAGG